MSRRKDRTQLRADVRAKAEAERFYVSTRPVADRAPEADVSNKPDRCCGAVDAKPIPAVAFHTQIRNGGQIVHSD